MRPAADACTFSLPVTGFAMVAVITWALVAIGLGAVFVVVARRAGRFGRFGTGVAAVLVAVALGTSVGAPSADAACDPTAAPGVALGVTTTTSQVGSFAVPVATTVVPTTSTTLVGSLAAGASTTTSTTTSTTIAGSSVPPAEVPEVPITVLAPLSAAMLMAAGFVVRRRSSASAH